MKLHTFRHVPFEGLGTIEKWARAKKFPMTETRFWENPVLPSLEDLDFLVVMGGPMNIYEEDKYPWLKAEKQFIGEAIREGKTVLGVCLGAQLLADVLGGRVTKNREKEIGWFPVSWTPEAGASSVFGNLPGDMRAFHWHGDTFSIPSGAVRIAESEACLNQAFQYENRVVGLQFHMEMTPENIRLLVENGKNELLDASYIQSEKDVLEEKRFFKPLEEGMNSILEAMITKSPFETAMFGAGCFWDVEETFRKLKGVKSTAVGYAGGSYQDPTYEDVCEGNTGHAEVVYLQYDSSEISYDDLLNVFWKNHNPTTLNRQGPDFGEQYRSVIFFYTPGQEAAALHSKTALEKSGKWKSPVVTEIKPAVTFYRAGDYHQQYLKKRELGSCRL